MSSRRLAFYTKGEFTDIAHKDDCNPVPFMEYAYTVKTVPGDGTSPRWSGNNPIGLEPQSQSCTRRAQRPAALAGFSSPLLKCNTACFPPVAGRRPCCLNDRRRRENECFDCLLDSAGSDARTLLRTIIRLDLLSAVVRVVLTIISRRYCAMRSSGMTTLLSGPASAPRKPRDILQIPGNYHSR